MSLNNDFIIITDSASNLTYDILKIYDIKMISYIIEVDGKETYCYNEEIDFEILAKDYYDKMRNDVVIKTSLVNGERFADKAEPYLKEGKDVLFISLSSGVSGTFNSVNNKCAELKEKYPERECIAFDSMGASLGEGLLAIKAAELRKDGLNILETVEELKISRGKLRQIFTVDDLKYLMKGGRISKLTAVVGSLLNIKPLLKGNEQGQIVSYGKIKGKKRALETLAKECAETIVNAEEQTIAISHCDSLSDAEYLAEKIKELSPVKNVLIRSYDMCTGAYVGPGTVALFFWGDKR